MSYHGNRGGSSYPRGAGAVGRGGYPAHGQNQSRGGYNSYSNGRGGRGGYQDVRGGYQGGQRGGYNGPSIQRGGAADIVQPEDVKFGRVKLNPKENQMAVERFAYADYKPMSVYYVKAIWLLANHFKVSIKSSIGTIWMHNVEITQPGASEPPNGRLPRTVTEAVMAKFVADDESLPEDQRLFWKQPTDQNSKGSKITAVYDGNKILYTSSEILYTSSEIVSTSSEIVSDSGVTRQVEIIETDPLFGGAGDTLEMIEKRTKKFSMTINKSKSMDMSKLESPFGDNSYHEVQDLITALQIILRHCPSQNKIMIGQNTLFPLIEIDRATQNPNNHLGGGAFAVDGHFQSVRPAGDGLTMVINRSTSAFYPNGKLWNFLSNLCGGQDRDIMDMLLKNGHVLNSAMSKITLVTKHNGYKKKFTQYVGLSRDKLCDLYVDDSKSQSLINYYHEKYGEFLDRAGIDLRTNTNKNLPAMKFRTGKDPITKQPRIVQIPIALLWMKDNSHVPGLLSAEQTGAIIKKTAIKPGQRLWAIKNIAKSIKNDSVGILKEFGLDMDVELAKLPGFILRTPRINCGAKVQNVADGQWRFDRLTEPASCSSWVIWDLIQRPDSKLDEFKAELFRQAQTFGMNIKNLIREHGRNVGLKQVMESIPVQSRSKSWILIYGLQGDPLYDEIKYRLETKKHNIGIVTQVVNHNKVQKGMRQYVTNLLLKINVKLGGVNFIIDTNDIPAALKSDKNVMILGADVTHAAFESGASSASVPHSVASLCASYDKNYVRYYTTTHVQEKPQGKDQQSQEMITNIDAMFLEAAKFYKSKNLKYPSHIIYYRDGVSEGQFKTVLDEELVRIKKASKILDPKYDPKITLIIVGKRHHTRFIPEFEVDSNRFGNVKAGTLADSVITHPVIFDFYLASADGIQGTTRPSHYSVIYDDHKFTCDELYQMSFFLCHTYMKCSKSISIPAPVQYAHLAATRSRSFIKARKFGHLEQVSAGSDSSSDIIATQRQQIRTTRIDEMNQCVQVVDSLRSRLYFC